MGNNHVQVLLAMRTRPKWFWAISMSLILVALQGCGYQFTVEGPGPTIGGAPEEMMRRGPAPRLVIQNIDNTSFESQLSQKYTRYLRREFALGSGAEVVSSPESADLLLRGNISSVQIPALSYTKDTTFENRALVTISVSVQDLRTNKVVWRQSATGASEFFITNDLQFNRQLQRRAVEQAGEQIAGDLAARFLAYLESTAQAGVAGESASPKADVSSLPPILPTESGSAMSAPTLVRP